MSEFLCDRCKLPFNLSDLTDFDDELVCETCLGLPGDASADVGDLGGEAGGA